jgi:NAD(P)-dependent dehydrogenase (short-subunit alcohol dehydrogenase family)
MTSDINRVVFVSGANRGIGLELVRQFAENSAIVFAGYRVKSRALGLFQLAGKNDRLLPVKVDITNEDDVKALAKTIKEKAGRLDLLINNAGISLKYYDNLAAINLDDLMDNFRVNVGGTHLVVKHLYPLVKKGNEKKIINISSTMGSIEKSSGGSTPYRVSKAALNMLTKNQAIEYGQDSVIVVAVHPGWVRTDMGGSNAHLSPEESVTGMLQVIETLTRDNSGELWSYAGNKIPY